MDTVSFLQRILPPTGLYVAARLINGKFKNQPCDSIEELAQQVLAYDAQGVHAYHACAAFSSRSVATTKPDGSIWHQVRTHKNVRALRSFFLDLDVEPGNPKKFESQEQACEELVKFCTTTGLPLPLLLSSGGGCHAYWTLENEIIPEQWRVAAEGIKNLCAAHKFVADPACTSDMARVLRPVGTFNRKSNPPVPVELIADSAPVVFNQFTELVLSALKRAGVKAPDPIRQVEAKGEELNQQFAVQREFPPCSIAKVAEKCAQVRVVRDTRGNVSEPHWYHFVQLACHSTEGDPTIHAWSNGHAGYSAAETDRKIEQIRGQAIGPTLCSMFESKVPGGCDGCPFRGKISSPAQLGTQIASAPAPTVVIPATFTTPATVVTLPNPPPPFTRGEKGGIYIEDDGITHLVHKYDAFPTELAFDEQLGYETMRWRHWLPNEGWKEFVVRSSLVVKPADFVAALVDNHLQPLIKGKFVMYGDAFIRTIRDNTKLRQLFKSQGWKEDNTAFVLGDKLYKKDEVVQAGFSHGVGEFLTPFHPRGSLDTWRAMTSILETPGFEPHAFMLLLAFAAPLFQLAGREGCTVNALGQSGAGKSTMARFMSSVYGSPKGAWVGRKDTELARMQRLGAHFNLPVYMDEATTILPKELRDLVYAIPTGKNRSSMKQDYSLRKSSEWCTLLITSTNDSLQTKLQMEKANAEAETLRLFEFGFPKVSDFGQIAKIIPGVLDDHYGVAGPVYIQYLVQNREAVITRLKTVVEEAEREFGMQDHERFWSQVAALTLYGGELAREAGVIEFDPNRIRPWLKHETHRMRGAKDDNYVTATDILANFLNEHVGERLTVTNINKDMAATDTRLFHELSQRYDKDTNTLWVSRKRIKNYIDKEHFDYHATREELMRIGILLDARVLRTLGAGTIYSGGQTACWKINASHPALLGVL